MYFLKYLFLSCAFLYSVESFAQQAPATDSPLIWYTDLIKANEISQNTGKPIFAFFTGSDWCPWCRKMQQDVFSKPEFIAWAKKNIVLLELDFPKNKIQDPAIVNQNKLLQQAFQVQGYPTVCLFFLTKKTADSQYTIDALGTMGYPAGTEKGKEEIKFIKDADFILGKNRKH